MERHGDPSGDVMTVHFLREIDERFLSNCFRIIGVVEEHHFEEMVRINGREEIAQLFGVFRKLVRSISNNNQLAHSLETSIPNRVILVVVEVLGNKLISRETKEYRRVRNVQAFARGKR